MLTTRQECSTAAEIDAGGEVWAVTFTAGGKHLVSGDNEGVRVWRVEDGKEMANMKTRRVHCLVVSQEGRWIAAGTGWGDVFVWDANSYEQVFKHKEDYWSIQGLDFSPNSARLVSASNNGTAIIWDLVTYQKVQTLQHKGCVIAAKYAPQGDRIATATDDAVRVYGFDGCVLVDIKVAVTPWRNNGLTWFNDHLFVLSDGKIKRFDASSGSALSEWPVPDSNDDSCITLPKHGAYIAYSTKRTVTFWDTSTHSPLGRIQHPGDIRSIAFSPGDRFLSLCGEGEKINIENLSRLIVGTVFR